MKLTIMKAWALICMGALAGLAACTDLYTYKFDGDSTDPPPGSFPFALARTKVAVAYTLQLTKCGVAGSTYPSMAVKVTAVASQSFEADPAERYYIPVKHLTGLFKNSSLKLSEGTDQSLQALNAEYSDQTLQVAGAGLQAAASMAGSVLTAAVPVNAIAQKIAPDKQVEADVVIERKRVKPQPAEGQRVAPPVAGACSHDADQALKKYNEDHSKLEKQVKNSRVANPASDAAVSFATTQVADDQGKITATIVRTILPESDKSLVNTGTKSEIQKYSYPMDLITYVTTLWGDSTIAGPIQISFNEHPLILGCPAGQGASAGASAECIPLESGKAKQDGEIDLYVYRSTMEVNSASLPPNFDSCGPNSEGRFKGVMLRQPAAAFLRVCEGACAEPDAQGIVLTPSTSPAFDTATKAPLTIPQFGKKFCVLMHSHIGDDVNIGLLLAADGSPTSLSLTNNSTASSGAGAINSAATAYTAAVTAQNNAITAQNGAITAANGAVTAQAGLATTNAGLATSAANLTATTVQLNDVKLKAQADCLAQQAAILKAGGVPSASCQ
jgi:hypothetical protein